MAEALLSMKSDLSWTVPVLLEDVPETGQRIELIAPEPVRADLAKQAGLRSLPRLEATFDVRPLGDGLHVTGRVKAMVGQTCVVSLEPLDSEVDEAVDLTFSSSIAPEPDEIVVPPGGEIQDPPEPLVDERIDLAALAVEFLMLGIDPYPRKAGADFQPPVGTEVDDARPNPFAALAVLKTRNGEGRG